MVEFKIELTGQGEGDVEKVKAQFAKMVTAFRKDSLDVNGYVNAHETGKGLGARSAINVHTGDLPWPGAKKAEAPTEG